MNRSGDLGFAAFVGIDWADAKHDVCLLDAKGDQREFSVIIQSGSD